MADAEPIILISFCTNEVHTYREFNETEKKGVQYLVNWHNTKNFISRK